MRIRAISPTRADIASGFSIAEVVLSMALIVIITVALYGGMSFGFEMVTLARQNLRATQIALEKMETMRMYSWDEVNSNGFVPAAFTAPFFPTITTNSTNDGGLTYYGTTSITIDTNIQTTYSNDMRLVVVSVTWTNKKQAFSRSLQTYISQYGMQRYIY